MRPEEPGRDKLSAEGGLEARDDGLVCAAGRLAGGGAWMTRLCIEGGLVSDLLVTFDFGLLIVSIVGCCGSVWAVCDVGCGCEAGGS